MFASSRGILPATLIFTVFYVACLYWEQEIDAALWILSGALWLFIWGLCLVLLAVTIWQVCKNRQESRQTVTALLTLVLLAVPVTIEKRFGGLPIRDFRFRLARPAYEVRVARMLHSPEALKAETATHGVQVDRTAGTTRIAFVEPGGILDNWIGLVYDPTGMVEQINQARSWEDWEAPRFLTVRKLFGGDMTYAHPLGGGWYRCTFT